MRATDGPISRALGARPGSMSRADGTNLAEEHRADELVDLGRVVQELQLLEHHLVLVVLRHQLAERLAHLCVLCRTRQSAIAARPPGAAPARAQVPGAADRPTRTNTRGPADALTRSAIRAGTSMGMARWQHGASARGGTAGSVGGGKGQPQQGGAEQRSEVAPVAGRPRGAHRASASASGAARALVPFPRPPVIHPRHSLPPPRPPFCMLWNALISSSMRFCMSASAMFHACTRCFRSHGVLCPTQWRGAAALPLPSAHVVNADRDLVPRRPRTDARQQPPSIRRTAAITAAKVAR